MGPEIVVKDYYRVLGVAVEAKTDEIKKAYRLLAKICHPDVRPGEENPEAQEKFKEITEAYEVLVNPERRKKYDQMARIRWKTPGVPGADTAGAEEVAVEWTATSLEEPGGADAGEAGKDAPGADPVARTEARAEGPPVPPRARARKPAGGNAGPRFDPPGTPAEPPAGSAGGSARVVEVPVSFEMAVKGGVRVTTVPMEEKCGKCGGTGARSKRAMTVCPVCGGSGRPPGSESEDAGTCPRCKGRGALVRERCTRCQGSGWSRKDRKIAVRVDPGEEDGSRRPLSEVIDSPEGLDGGGIEVEFRIRAHPFFRRHGLDILCEAPIGLETAILGGEVPVRTALGKRVVIKVPAGTDSGTTFRVKDEGIGREGRKGHQFVTVKIVTPKRLSGKAREYLDLFLREIRR